MNGAFLQDGPDGCALRIWVQPRASREEIVGVHGDELKIRVTAPPVDDAANAALVKFLATKLGCPRGSVRLVRGQTSRHKTVRVTGLRRDEVVARLAAAT